ncbi:DNA replication and repair protein RecO [Actinobaculum suis]|uniref:DNA repair protein RecO n=1 Tax=Actinobaculum suis TaxID=1657 RepID=A0A1G7EJJ9_9ACTO|nr:DNA replication and repair protein RecO [Actinobaculum suis]
MSRRDNPTRALCARAPFSPGSFQRGPCSPRRVTAGAGSSGQACDNSQVKLYRDEAVVLRTHDLGEADRIITLISRNHGIMRGVAKGVRRTKSRFGARLEPFSLVDIQMYRGRNLDTVTEVACLVPFGREISTDYEKYAAGSAMAEIVERLCAEGESDPEQYLLFLGALNVLANRQHRPGLVLASYILRALDIAGWRLAVEKCAVCGRPENLVAFNVQAGGMLCQQCATSGSARPSTDTVTLLRALLAGDWPTIDAAAPAVEKITGKYVKAYAQWHLERKIRSLDMVRPA